MNHGDQRDEQPDSQTANAFFVLLLLTLPADSQTWILLQQLRHAAERAAQDARLGHRTRRLWLRSTGRVIAGLLPRAMDRAYDALALCAEQYFMQSEQIPTRVRLAVGQVQTEAGSQWRAGGAMIQIIAGDETRGSTEEVWDRTRALFGTLADDELIDPTITPETLLFRLFHEDGVRLEGARPLTAVCRCSKDRIASVLASFDPAERAEMIEDDGRIHVTCEYCATVYALEPDEVVAASLARACPACHGRSPFHVQRKSKVNATVEAAGSRTRNAICALWPGSNTLLASSERSR